MLRRFTSDAPPEGALQQNQRLVLVLALWGTVVVQPSNTR